MGWVYLTRIKYYYFSGVVSRKVRRRNNKHNVDFQSHRKTITFLLLLVFLSTIFINLNTTQSQPLPVFNEDTIVIFWDQDITLNTSYAFNKGTISFGFSVTENSNSSVIFSLIHTTESGFTFDWSPSLEEGFTLDPGESFFSSHTFSTSDRSVALAIWYFCSVLTAGSNATILFNTSVVNVRQQMSFFGCGLTFLVSLIIAIAYKYSKKKSHLKIW